MGFTGSVLAIDPGYRTIGWSLFAAGQGSPDAPAALLRLERWGRKVLLVDGVIPRLSAVRDAAHEIVCAQLVDLICVELPAIAGQYGRHKGRKAEEGVQLMILATGAIIGEAIEHHGSAKVFTMQAPSGRWAKKERKHQWLREQFMQAGREEPRGAHGGEMPDVLDSVWLGVQVLRTPGLQRIA